MLPLRWLLQEKQDGGWPTAANHRVSGSGGMGQGMFLSLVSELCCFGGLLVTIVEERRVLLSHDCVKQVCYGVDTVACILEHLPILVYVSDLGVPAGHFTYLIPLPSHCHQGKMPASLSSG